MTRILHIDSSARLQGSVTRELSASIAKRLSGGDENFATYRDLSETLPLIDETWVGANFTPADQRSDLQKQALELSDDLIAELRAADTIVIGLPVYNFGVPAALKAWIDLIARVGETFSYTENGPVGLLEGKRAVIAMASGGTQAGSPIDFATPYLRHVLDFVGITDVQLVSAAGGASLDDAREAVEALAA